MAQKAPWEKPSSAWFIVSDINVTKSREAEGLCAWAGQFSAKKRAKYGGRWKGANNVRAVIFPGSLKEQLGRWDQREAIDQRACFDSLKPRRWQNFYTRAWQLLGLLESDSGKKDKTLCIDSGHIILSGSSPFLNQCKFSWQGREIGLDPQRFLMTLRCIS